MASTRRVARTFRNPLAWRQRASDQLLREVSGEASARRRCSRGARRRQALQLSTSGAVARLRAAASHGHEGSRHVSRTLQHTLGIVVAQGLERFIERTPAIIGDALVRLRSHLAGRALEQEEVTELVDVAAAKAEMPVDDPDWTVHDQVGETGLLAGFPAGGLGRRFLTLEMALRKTPVAVGIANEQETGGTVRLSPEHDPPAETSRSGRLLPIAFLKSVSGER